MKQKEVILILSLSFVVIVAWIISNVFHVQHESTISEELNAQIAPIDQNFNTTIIQKLKERDQVVPLYTAVSSTSAAAQPIPTPTTIAGSKTGQAPTKPASQPAGTNTP
jgi:hypothetical protein